MISAGGMRNVDRREGSGIGFLIETMTLRFLEDVLHSFFPKVIGRMVNALFHSEEKGNSDSMENVP